MPQEPTTTIAELDESVEDATEVAKHQEKIDEITKLVNYVVSCEGLEVDEKDLEGLDTAKFSITSYMLNNQNLCTPNIRTTGWHLVKHGFVQKQDIPLVGKAVYDFLTDNENDMGRSEYEQAKSGLLILLQGDNPIAEMFKGWTYDYLFDAIEKVESINPYETIALLKLIEQHLDYQNEGLVLQFENARSTFDTLSVGKLDFVQNRKAAWFLNPYFSNLLPLTTAETYRFLDANISSDNEIATDYIGQLDSTYMYVNTKPLLEKALNNSEAAKMFLKKIKTGQALWKYEVWVKDLIDQAEDVVKKDGELDEYLNETSAVSAQYIFDEVPIESTENNPWYEYNIGNLKDKNIVYGSNGFLAFMYEGIPQDARPSQIPPFLRHKVKEMLSDINPEIGFNIHFVPNNNSHFVSNNEIEVMRMGLRGATNFLEFCTRTNVPDNVVLYGTTNSRMAKIAKVMGFVTPDLTDEELNDPTHHENYPVNIVSTIQQLKQALAAINARMKTNKKD